MKTEYLVKTSTGQVYTFNENWLAEGRAQELWRMAGELGVRITVSRVKRDILEETESDTWSEARAKDEGFAHNGIGAHRDTVTVTMSREGVE